MIALPKKPAGGFVLLCNLWLTLEEPEKEGYLGRHPEGTRRLPKPHHRLSRDHIA
jgi:hypothetical protein